MNNTQGGQQGQPSGAPQQEGQPQQQQQRKPIIFRPEQMRNLPAQFTAEEKVKWENGLKNLWSEMEKHGQDTPQHQTAKKKLFDFSKNLTAKMHNFRLQQQAQAQGQAQAQQGQTPASQGQPQQQGGESSAGNQSQIPQQQQPQRPAVSKKLLDHVNGFPYVHPSPLAAGTPEAAKWIQDAKNRYLKGLMAMENGNTRIQQFDQMVQKRQGEEKPLSAEEEKEYKEKKEAAQKTYTDAKQFVDNFRSQQASARGGPSSTATQPQQANENQAQQGNGKPVQEAPTRPQLNTQQPANPALQSTQTVNAAIEAARNQQMGGGRAVSNGMAPQIPSQNGPSQQGVQQPQGQQVKMEGGPAPINTAVNQIQNQHRNSLGNNSPQSGIPQSAGPQSAVQGQGHPRALSHSAALNQAARSYSIPQQPGQSGVIGMGHSHPAPSRELNSSLTQKMPIPKQLPERAAAPPQPVTMASSRPSLSGGPNNASNGSMGQPVLTHLPPFDMHAEGERVLSKKKLDELVRQVTGGGQNLEGGESLTPEVENSIMNVADNFVDQVLLAACKNAKERGSKLLEIRDIQLTLERAYNIRIPGYASDEIRTVRKIQPSANWISKMSAVQAAKVTGGKNSD